MRSTTALAAGLTLGAAMAGADTVHWNGTGADGVWADPGNWEDSAGIPIGGGAPGLDGVPADVVLGDAAAGAIDLEAGRATLSALELTGGSDAVLTEGTLAFALPGGASGSAARLTVAGSGGFMDETLAFVLEDDLLVEAAVDTGLAGDISGTGTLRLRAAPGAEIALSGTNSQTGGTVLEEGKAVVSGGAALADDATLTLSGGIDGRAASVLRIEDDETVGGLASAAGAAGALELTGGGLTVAGGGSSDFGLAITGSGGLTVTGGSSVALEGSLSGFQGGFRVEDGRLRIGDAAGALNDNAVALAGGTLVADIADDFGGAISTEAGTASGLVAAAGSSLTLTGTMDLAGDLSFSAEAAGATVALQMASVAMADGVTLGFDSATFQVGSDAAAAAFAAAAGTRIGSDAVLDLAGRDAGIAALTGNGTILSGSGDATVSLGEGSDFGGVLADGAAGRLSLVTDGTVLLTGQNTLSGGTSVSGGTLTLAGDGRLGDVEVASAGRFVLDEGSAGAVVNSGTGSANADRIAALTQKAGSFDNSGTVTGATSVEGGTLSNSGRLSGAVTVSGGTLSSDGQIDDTLTVSGGMAEIDGSVTGAVEVSGGRLEAGEDSALNGGLAVSDGDAETAGTVSGGVSVTGGRYDNSGGVTGGLELAAGTVGNTGSIGGAVTVAGGALTNSGTLSDDVSVEGGSLSSSGRIGGALDVSGGTATNGGTVGGKSTVGGGGVLVSEGGSFGDDLSIEGDTGSGAGTLRLSGTTTVAGNVTNDGRIETAGGAAAALTLTGGGGFTTNGSIAARNGALTVSADTITIGDGASMTGDIDFVGAVVNDGELDLQNDLRDTLETGQGGLTRIVESLDGAGNDVENAGRLEVGDGVALTGVGTVSNSGTVEVGTGGRLEAGRIENDGTLTLGAGAALEGTGNTLINTGDINVADGGSVTDTGAIENLGTGLIAFAGGGTIASDSDGAGDEAITNAGRIVTTDGGNDTITLGGATPNVLSNTSTGSIEIGDSDSVTGTETTLDNAGSVTIGTGATLALAALDTATGGSVTNDGRLEADTVTSAGSLTNTAGAEIAADVTSSGTLGNAGTISGDLSVTGGTATSSGSLQDVSVSAGALTVTAGSLTGLSVSGGSASLEGGALSGDLDVSGGTADVDIAVGGTADVTGGTLAIGATGSVAAQTTVGSAGRLETAGTLASLTSAGQVENTGSITGDAAVTGGQTGNSGTIGGSVAASGGTFLSSGTVSGDVAATGGALASVSGRIGGALTAGSGSEARVTGDLALDGGLGIAGGGTFALQSGTLTMADSTDAVNDGTATIAAGTLKGGTGGSFRNRDGARLSVAATGKLETDLVNAESAEAEIDGTVAGAVDNDGEILLGGTIDGTLGNDGTVRVAAGDAAGITGAIAGLGSYLVAGSLDFGSSFDLGRGGTTDGRLSLGENATVTGGLVTSYGTVTLADGSRLEADLTSSGLLRASGSATVDGDLSLSNGAALSLSDGTTGDRLQVTGNADLNGTIGMDIDLTDGAQSADAISIDGVASGSVVLAFNDLTAGDYGQIRNRLDLLSYGSDGGLSVSSTGLPSSGSILYRLDRNASGDGWGLISGANPAFGGLASGLALTQSLIGSVVNRPTSPYVSGLASTEGSPCGWGSWGRAMGGKATASGSSHTDLGSFSTEIDASYGGVQAGLDYSCFDGGEGGWNLSFGAIVGLNDGSIRQPVYLFDPDTGTVNAGIQTSRNQTDFQQLYGGAYVGASRGRFFADLQVTLNRTEFDLENRVAPGAFGERLGVDDQSYDSTGHTVSGTMGYALPLGRDSGFSLIPSLGFSISRTKSDDLYFGNDPADDADDGVLKFDPITNQIGFASVTLSRSRVLPSGVSALNLFATATAYHDFSDRSVAKYYELDSNGVPLGAPMLSENDGLGDYRELSAGFNYTRVFGKGQAGPARQMDASLRVDSRFGDDLDGWGVTAQMRFQF
ncbi:hypothetical protein [Rhodovulum viride]|nr:hypothetical protein [Rhodovulum viride]